jgi:hypothetical protein
VTPVAIYAIQHIALYAMTLMQTRLIPIQVFVSAILAFMETVLFVRHVALAVMFATQLTVSLVLIMQMLH